MIYRSRKDRRERHLRSLAQMLAAKARKRLENPTEHEPHMERWYPLELGVRDKLTGDCVWVDLRSVRDASRRLSVIQRFYA